MKFIQDKEKELKYGDDNCLLCGTNKSFRLLSENISFYDCEKCGCYGIPHWYMDYLKDPHSYIEIDFDIHKLRCYLFYHNDEIPAKIISPLGKQFKEENLEKITSSTLETWYPKSFKEKVDYILLKLAKLSKFEGDYVDTTKFVDVLFFCKAIKDGLEEIRDFNEQIEFMKSYFTSEGLFNCIGYKFQLLPKAWNRVYTLQDNLVGNLNVFVAMKFGKETEELRDKIKEGLEGFNVRIMDEIEHNHQIVPEMLYEIRNSKFVIVELSHHNNGAYYEAGYALGVGKEVIHICKKTKKRSKLHFDVAQVNTIFYDTIDEIPKKLKDRIKVTIK